MVSPICSILGDDRRQFALAANFSPSLPALEEITIGHHRGSPSDRHLEAAARRPRLRKMTVNVRAEVRRYTPAGIEAFRQARPDVHLTVDGQEYLSLASTEDGAAKADPQSATSK